MFSYLIINYPKFNLNKKTIDLIFESIYKSVSVTQKGLVNIVFIDSDSIQKLNKDHRGFDKVTDVLSFHYFDDFSNLKKDDTAGEIVLCEEKIVEQGVEYGLGSEKEFYKLLIHSVLHLLGYDHEEDSDYEIMSKLENIIWKEVFEK